MGCRRANIMNEDGKVPDLGNIQLDLVMVVADGLDLACSGTPMAVVLSTGQGCALVADSRSDMADSSATPNFEMCTSDTPNLRRIVTPAITILSQRSYSRACPVRFFGKTDKTIL